MSRQHKVAGVVLAGGLARRMQGADKGLVLYQNRPLISYALSALQSVADEIVINANRNLEHYSQFGFSVCSDQTAAFDGPLAGILAAMNCVDADILLVMPCDCPLFAGEHLEKLVAAQASSDAEVAMGFDGKRIQPLFLALKMSLKASLNAYLASGQRKVETWLAQQQVVHVNFSCCPSIFVNINSLAELSELENHQ